MEIKNLKMEKPFRGLFPIDKNIVEAIRKDIETNGYDLSHPIIVWKDRDIVIDGNTRVMAGKLAKLKNIPVDEKEFKDEAEALQYAIHNQRDRRNITDADLLRCIEAVDKRRPRGGDRKSEEAKSKGASEPIDSSAKVTAEIVGTSETKVKKARTILDSGDKEAKDEVLEGKKSIHKAYTERKSSKAIPVRPIPGPKIPTIDDVFSEIESHLLKIASTLTSKKLKENFQYVSPEMVKRLEIALGLFWEGMKQYQNILDPEKNIEHKLIEDAKETKEYNEEQSIDFDGLSKLYRSFFSALDNFSSGYWYKKRESKKYLKKIQLWISELNSFIEEWQQQAMAKRPKYKSRSTRAYEAANDFRSIADELREIDTSDKDAINKSNEIINKVDFSEVESLMEEMTSWRDNMEDSNLANTQKFEEVSECANELESINLEVSEIQEIGEIEEVASQLEEIADTLESLEFPGMFG